MVAILTGVLGIACGAISSDGEGVDDLEVPDVAIVIEQVALPDRLARA